MFLNCVQNKQSHSERLLLAGSRLDQQRAWSVVQRLWWKRVKGKRVPHGNNVLLWVERGGSSAPELGAGALMPAWEAGERQGRQGGLAGRIFVLPRDLSPMSNH